MLKHISIENFKALRKASIDFGLITVLIGKNSTGKSSILQTLATLKQSRGQSHLSFDGPYVYLGNYRDIVHKQEENREIRINTVVTQKPIEKIIKFDSEHDYRAVFQNIGIRNHRIKITLQDSSQYEGEYIFRPNNIRRTKPDKFQYNQANWNIRGEPDITRPISLRAHSIPGQIDEETARQYETVENCITRLFGTTYDTIGNIFYVPALRGFTKPRYNLTNEAIQDLSSVGTGDPQAQSVASTLAYRRDLETTISNWTERITGARLETVLTQNKQVAVEVVIGPRRINIVNEGFGTNQLIQPLLQLSIAPSGSMIAIEEPEIHIHPEAQSRLCDILVGIAKADRKQILITTHSEHIVTSILTSIAKRQLKPEELSVYFFNLEHGESKISELPVTQKGQIKGGLKGFFEASMGELEEYMQALGNENQ